MILLNDYEKKLVIPRWLSYAKAAGSLELSFPGATSFVLNGVTKQRLAEDHHDFKVSPTAHKASDLMGAAFVIGEDELAKELAKYVVGCGGLSKTVVELAECILGTLRKDVVTSNARLRIAQNKKFLNDFPANAYTWMERARLYTVMGQVEKAERCVRIALNLAPSDRYVARAAARFFVHANKIDEAWDYIRRASALTGDPWIKATEISIAEVANKKIKKLKGLVPMSPGKELYHYSELIESYGMLELMGGNDHKAKKCFKLAWSAPSTNVITHSEWIVRAHFPAMADIARENFSESLEAVAWQNYSNFKTDEALAAAIEWGLEEPYAKNAFCLGSSLAFKLDKFQTGVDIAKDGLRASPHDFTLQNNLCFGLLKMNRVEEAERNFPKQPPGDNPTGRVIYSATRGLLEFKRCNHGLGRALYSEAIAEAEALGDSRLIATVVLNRAITEAEENVVEARADAAAALKVSEKQSAADVVLTRQILLSRLAQLDKRQETLPFKEFHQLKIPPNH